MKPVDDDRQQTSEPFQTGDEIINPLNVSSVDSSQLGMLGHMW